MSYANTTSKHRRLAILRHLDDCSEYTSNASILTDVLAGVGLRSSRDQVTTELVWLKDNGMAVVQDFEDFIVVTATQQGLEVARGVTLHPGVQRRRPGV